MRIQLDRDTATRIMRDYQRILNDQKRSSSGMVSGLNSNITRWQPEVAYTTVNDRFIPDSRCVVEDAEFEVIKDDAQSK